MKMMKVEIISRETIKPSSPTPFHLRTFKLSFLDQLAPPVFVPIILFYSNNVKNNNIPTETWLAEQHNSLKESLSKCLTSFYPLAGRIKADDPLVVDCNDAGVEYLEARVINCNLSDVIEKLEVDALKQFLPIEPYSHEPRSAGNSLTESLLLSIQVSAFECGGIAIGVCISHKVADASSLTTFVKGWSAIARDGLINTSTTTIDCDHHDQVVVPRFDLASLFPSRDLAGFKATTGIRKEKIVTKRYVFNASNIAALREKASTGVISTNGSSSSSEPPTRVEAVSAFLSKRFMDLGRGRAKGGTSKQYAALYAMNLRKRRVPPLPEHCFGNMYGIAIATFSMENEEECSMAAKIRAAIREIGGEYVKKLESGDWYLNSIKAHAMRILKEEIVTLRFSSWCRFNLYDADFGWGKPAWLSTTTMPFKDVVILMDTRSGDGIEAWVNMMEEDMVEFERDQQLLAFAS